jgi:hypothetical protein
MIDTPYSRWITQAKGLVKTGVDCFFQLRRVHGLRCKDDIPAGSNGADFPEIQRLEHLFDVRHLEHAIAADIDTAQERRIFRNGIVHVCKSYDFKLLHRLNVFGN